MYMEKGNAVRSSINDLVAKTYEDAVNQAVRSIPSLSLRCLDRSPPLYHQSNRNRWISADRDAGEISPNPCPRLDQLVCIVSKDEG